MSASRLSAFAALAAVALLASGASRAATDTVVANANVPTISVTAESLGSSVKSAIRQAVGETSPEITVSVRDGKVDLSGWARNGSDVTNARFAALAVDGVNQVHANGVRVWSTRYYAN